MSHEMSASAANNSQFQVARGEDGKLLQYQHQHDPQAAYLQQVAAEQCGWLGQCLPDLSVQSSSKDKLFDTTESDYTNGSSNLMVYKDKYGNVLIVNPAEISFSDYQDIWIHKHWLDILARLLLVAPIVLLGILGNLIIIYSMCKFKPFRSKPTNIFILNMAIADLITSLLCPIIALFKDIYQFYVLGPFVCRIEGFVDVTCLLVSSYSLIVLSSDWLLCVVKPFRTRITIKKSWLVVVAIWVTSILLSAPLLVWREHRERQWKDILEVWCCEMVEYTKYYWVAINFLLIYIPTIFMTIVLVVILARMDRFEAKLRRSQVSLDQQVANGIGKISTPPNNCLSINMKYRRRIVKILFTYLSTSVICWTPLQFLIIYRHFRSKAIPEPWFFDLAFWAQLSASLTAAMNPIIFGFLSQPFRRIVTRCVKFRFFERMTDGTPAAGSKKHNACQAQPHLHPQPQVTPHLAQMHDQDYQHHHHQSQQKQALHHHQQQQQQAQKSALHAVSHVRSNPARPEALHRVTGSGTRHRSRRGSATDSKRVSFHTSNIIIGRDNEAVERSETPAALVWIEQVELPALHKSSNNTTSFMRSSQVPPSFVSMNSINIEENLNQRENRQSQNDGQENL